MQQFSKVLSVVLFVLLTGYLVFAGARLLLLLWQRFGLPAG